MAKSKMTMKADGKYQKKNKPVVFPIRMSPETLDILSEVAEWKGISTSTLARMWIMERLATEREKNPHRSSYGEWIKKEIELP